MNEKLNILLVEDDEVDVMLVKRALRDLKVDNDLVHASNGEEAMEYLNNENNKRPGIILLDLNMPRMGGLEFLGHAKVDDKHKTIPTIVLTSSEEKKDKQRAYEHGAAGYMVKPVRYDRFVEMMKNIRTYWTESQLP